MKDIYISGFADEISSSFDEQLKTVRELGMQYISLRSADTVSYTHLGVGEVGDRHTVYRLQRDGAIIALSVPQAGRDHIFRHLVPKPQRCCCLLYTSRCV